MPPPAINVGGSVVDVSVGGRGHNEYGQLGYGHTDTLGDDPGDLPTPDLELGGLVDYLAPGTSGLHACADASFPAKRSPKLQSGLGDPRGRGGVAAAQR